MDGTFPGKEWETRLPAELGFSAEKLGGVEKWLRASNRDATFRVVIARDGYLAAEWNQGADADEQMGQASASKSYFSCMLGMCPSCGPDQHPLGGDTAALPVAAPALRSIPGQALPQGSISWVMVNGLIATNVPLTSHPPEYVESKFENRV